MIYNIDFNLSAIVILLFITAYVIAKKGLTKRANRIYLAIIISCLLCTFADIMCAYMNSFPNPEKILRQDIWNNTYMILHNVLPFLIAVYLIYELRIIKLMRRDSIIILSIPLIAVEILVLINPANRLAFYYDDAGRYTRGPLFNVFYLVAVLYIFFAVVMAVKNRHSMSHAKQMMLVFLMLASILPIMIQAVYPYVPIESFFQSMGLLGLLFTLDDKGDIIDHNTGIYNRYSFIEYMGSLLEGSDAQLITVKLSDINYYNSTIGVQYVNDILKEIAAWLQRTGGDMQCYYCGNGCFVLCGMYMAEEQTNLLKEEIFARFDDPWGKRDFQSVFPVQICTVRIPRDVSTLEQILLLIDMKFKGNDSNELNALTAISSYQHRIKTESAVKKALKNGSFKVYYQPIWDKKTGTILSAEALLRLFDDELGFIPPDEFIPVAEKNGTILDIGAFVFDEVCRFYQERQLDRIGVQYVDINLSVVQCMNRRLVNEFERTMAKYQISPERINLEITESATADSPGALAGTVKSLFDKGFDISLDDFGTGYSNFSYMVEMPFTAVKLDKSILWSAIHPKSGEGDENAMLYLENTIRMLHEMHYKITVEGVETVEQKVLLEKLGCDQLQGFYFSKPVPGDTFIDFVKVVNA